MKRPDIDLLLKKSKGKPVSLDLYEEYRDIDSMTTRMKKTTVVVRNSHDVKITESKKGFVGWVL